MFDPTTLVWTKTTLGVGGFHRFAMGNPITLRWTRTSLYVGLTQRLGVALESKYH
jgi:hypothetical protein